MLLPICRSGRIASQALPQVLSESELASASHRAALYEGLSTERRGLRISTVFALASLAAGRNRSLQQHHNSGMGPGLSRITAGFSHSFAACGT